MIQPLSQNEFQALSQQSERVVIFREIEQNHLNPIQVYEAVRKELGEGAILESLSHAHGKLVSYLFFTPFAEVIAKDGLVSTRIQNQKREHHDHPFSIIKKCLKEFNIATREDIQNRFSPVVGQITYDAIRYIEKIPDRHHDDALSTPDLIFNFYKINLIFDHQKQRILLCVVVNTNNDPIKAYQQGCKELDNLVELISNNNVTTNDIYTKPSDPLDISVDVSDEAYMQMVEAAKNAIIQGEAFQIVVSRCFKLPYQVPPLQIYKTLRKVSPAPFMFYTQYNNDQVIGASPERLVQVHEGKIAVNPIAGTRKRTSVSDEVINEKELLSDPKEVAEHMMLVDLARNDVGSASIPGTVKVDELLQVKHYSHVSHIVSTVSGSLENKYDCLDAFMATFPAGTLSGAPKIRAMEIIDELETSRRGLYGGSICRITANGDMESCIAIRMATLKNGVATIRAGAGIVFDSDPRSEAEETRKKASALCEAIQKAHGELP